MGTPLTFDPHGWLHSWRDAGGSFALVDGRLILGSIVGGGDNNRRRSELIATLTRAPGAKQAIAAVLAQPLEAA